MSRRSFVTQQTFDDTNLVKVKPLKVHISCYLQKQGCFIVLFMNLFSQK